MISLLGNTFFADYGIYVLLVGVLALLMVLAFTRRKRERGNREELNSKIAVGAKVKTYGGLYGKVASIEETTDGKIVLLETGEGKHVSYQTIHINAIYGLDDKQPVVLDQDQNVFIDLDALEREREQELKKAMGEEEAQEPVVAPAPKKATTAKKTTATSKSTTTRKTTAKK